MNTCQLCGEETSNPKFCSRKCAVTVNNRLSVKRKKNHGLRTTVVRGKTVTVALCFICGNRRQTEVVPFVCYSCEKSQWIEDWISGRDVQLHSSVAAKTALRKLHKNKCEECGWNRTSEWATEVPLTLEHRDGNPENNVFSNLQLLCPGCHALTENFCGRNTSASRAKRGLLPVPKPRNRVRDRAAWRD